MATSIVIPTFVHKLYVAARATGRRGIERGATETALASSCVTNLSDDFRTSHTLFLDTQRADLCPSSEGLFIKAVTEGRFVLYDGEYLVKFVGMIACLKLSTQSLGMMNDWFQIHACRDYNLGAVSVDSQGEDFGFRFIKDWFENHPRRKKNPVLFKDVEQALAKWLPASTS